MITRKQTNYLTYRLKTHRLFPAGTANFEKWAFTNLENWDVQELIGLADKYEAEWDEKYLTELKNRLGGLGYKTLKK